MGNSMHSGPLFLMTIFSAFFGTDSALAQQRIDEGDTSSGAPCINFPIPPTAFDQFGKPAASDIEGLSANSNFTTFMKEGVPCDSRTRALRKLWTDPMYNEIGPHE